MGISQLLSTGKAKLASLACALLLAGCSAAVIAGVAPEQALADVASQPMYRMFNPATGEHFYTASTTERDYLQVDPKGKWKYEGVAWNAPTGESYAQVYRLLYPRTGDHHYTTDANEVKVLTTERGWKQEAGGWRTLGKNDGGMPLYRYYHENMPIGGHHYTKDINEGTEIVLTRGWIEEEVGWYGLPEGASSTAPSAQRTEFVVNTNSGLFHRPSCATIKNMKPAHRRDVHSLASILVSQKYQPCKVCKPA